MIIGAGGKSVNARENKLGGPSESYFLPCHKDRVPILRVFCEGWDKQKLREEPQVKSSGIPPFANSAKDGAPNPLLQGTIGP